MADVFALREGLPVNRTHAVPTPLAAIAVDAIDARNRIRSGRAEGLAVARWAGRNPDAKSRRFAAR